MFIRNSALSLCLLTIVTTGLALPSSVTSPHTSDETPTAERRTLKLVKTLPLKKFKKLNKWLPHVFAKTEYSGVPTPIYKVHRYHGIELKPVTDVNEVSFLASEPVVENHDFLPSSPNFVNYNTYLQQPALPPTPPVFDSVPYTLNQPFLPTPLPVTTSFVFPQPTPLSIAKPVLPEVHNLHQTVTVTSTPTPPVSVVTSNPVNIPAPVTADAPLLPPLSLPQAFSTLPLALPSPPPLTVFPTLATPSAHVLTSNGPHVVQSVIKDVGEEHYPEEIEHVEPSVTIVKEEHDPSLKQVFLAPEKVPSLLKKVKGWKLDKITSLLNRLHKIKALKRPVTVSHSIPIKVVENPPENFHAPVVVPSFTSVHYTEPVHTPLVYPTPLLLPAVTSSFNFVPTQYENFPPYWNNFPQQTQLFNSYGAPIPFDSYALPHYFSHDRTSAAGAATEQKTSVLPPPPSFTETTQQEATRQSEPEKEIDQKQQLQIENVRDIRTAEDYQKDLPQAIHADLRPIYVPEPNKAEEKDSQSIETYEETKNENLEANHPTEQSQNAE